MSEELCKFCTGVHFSIAKTNLTIYRVKCASYSRNTIGYHKSYTLLANNPVKLSHRPSCGAQVTHGASIFRNKTFLIKVWPMLYVDDPSLRIVPLINYPKTRGLCRQTVEIAFYILKCNFYSNSEFDFEFYYEVVYPIDCEFDFEFGDEFDFLFHCEFDFEFDYEFVFRLHSKNGANWINIILFDCSRLPVALDKGHFLDSWNPEIPRLERDPNPPSMDCQLRLSPELIWHTSVPGTCFILRCYHPPLNTIEQVGRYHQLRYRTSKPMINEGKAMDYIVSRASRESIVYDARQYQDGDDSNTSIYSVNMVVKMLGDNRSKCIDKPALMLRKSFPSELIIASLKQLGNTSPPQFKLCRHYRYVTPLHSTDIQEDHFVQKLSSAIEMTTCSIVWQYQLVRIFTHCRIEPGLKTGSN
ncbi:unnamed protein product, partial [Nesidiocoris tenuis]